VLDLRLYRVPEVAKILGVGRTTVYALIKSGDLPSVRVAGCRRVSSHDLESYVANLTSRV
jgi:excisionase family DNA binding protein